MQVNIAREVIGSAGFIGMKKNAVSPCFEGVADSQALRISFKQLERGEIFLGVLV